MPVLQHKKEIIQNLYLIFLLLVFLWDETTFYFNSQHKITSKTCCFYCCPAWTGSLDLLRPTAVISVCMENIKHTPVDSFTSEEPSRGSVSVLWTHIYLDGSQVICHDSLEHLLLTWVRISSWPIMCSSAFAMPEGTFPSEVWLSDWWWREGSCVVWVCRVEEELMLGSL